jgi:hypothetical protein
MAIPELLKPFLSALLLALIVAVWFFLKRLPGSLLSLRGNDWPMVQGRIVGVKVITFAAQSLAELAYSYSIEGERYSGYFLRQFADEQDAWKFVRPADGQSIFVRYQPAKPSISSIRIQDQGPLFAAPEKNFVSRLIQRALADYLGISGWRELTVVGARRWPSVKGKVESATVVQRRERPSILYIPIYVAEIGYSYSVAGEYFSGYFERTFYRESSAQKFADSWREKIVSIRYRTASPEISFFFVKDQEKSDAVQEPQLNLN